MYKKLVFLMVISSLYGCGGGGGGSIYGDGGSDDTTPPTVITASPPEGANCVATSTNVKPTFSEILGAAFVNATTFSVRTGGAKISGSVSYGGTFATFIPSSSLTAFTGYTAVLTTGIKDSNGNPLASNYIWGFSTGNAAATVSYATDIQPIFNTYCTIGCHQTGGTASFLPLADTESYKNLINVASAMTTGGGFRVKPCDSANSVLYQRISGIGLAAGEETMPQNLSPLNITLQNRIKAWIDEGALNN